MKCRKAQKLISSYSELDPFQQERLNEHLQVCPGCSHEFILYQNSINLAKEATHFEESENFWQDYQVDLGRKIPPTSLWRRAWTQVEELTSLIWAPVLGPVPAYVLPIAIGLLLTLSLYTGLLSPKKAEAFNNNLVAYEGELLSAVDDGGVTVYTLKGK